MKRVNFVILFALMACSYSFAWDDCPFGLVNDRYPGKCGLYEDSNHDSICDHSQHRLLQGAIAMDSVTLHAVAHAPAQRKKQQAREITPRQPAAPIAPTVISMAPAQAIAAPVLPSAQRNVPSPLRQRYPLWQIFLITAILAVTTELLAAYNRKLTLSLQAAWNWALLLSFLLTVAFCVPFVYPALFMSINFNLAYWHSLTGLVMIAIGLYHFVRRWGSMWRGARSWFGIIGRGPGQRPD